MESAIKEKLNSQLDEVVDSRLSKRMADLRTTFFKEFEEELREGRMTIGPHASTPGFLSQIQSGVSEAGSPGPNVPMDIEPIQASIPTDAMVSATSTRENDAVGCGPDSLALSQYDCTWKKT